MSILIISDIHGSAKCLQDVLNTPYNYEAVLLVGDLMYHGPRNPILKDYNPQLVSEVLNTIKKPIVAVRGNCDAEVDQMLLNFNMMQDYTLFPYKEFYIYVTHGHLEVPNFTDFNLRTDIFISGHTHVPVINKLNEMWIYNPGSISLPKEGHPATYGYFDGSNLNIYTLNHELYMHQAIAKNA